MIIAVDFDGTITRESKWPDLGEPNLPFINELIRRRKNGDKLILTGRSEQKLEDINLEEKAVYINRKVNIFLCISCILLSFTPLIPVEDNVLNIFQILFDHSYNFKNEQVIIASFYLIIPVIYSYHLYCYTQRKYSYLFMDLNGMSERVAPALLCILNMMMLNFCGTKITTNFLICILLMFLRMLIAFFLLICYASGDELFLLFLKSKKKH
jgi:hypothetical protein